MSAINEILRIIEKPSENEVYAVSLIVGALIALLFVLTFGFGVFAYSPVSFDSANMVLPGSYSPVSFDSANMVLGGGNVSDSCTYGGSGDWAIDCGDNCTVSTNYALGGNDVTIIGNGKITITSNITGATSIIVKGNSASAICEVYTFKGGFK